MVEHQPSKLDTWVRFPSPALFNKCGNPVKSRVPVFLSTKIDGTFGTIRTMICNARFRIKKEQKIHEVFKEGLSEEPLFHPYHACPMEITQDDLVRIFQGLIEKYFEKPFEKYCEDSIRKIERLVESVNKEEEDWKIK